MYTRDYPCWCTAVSTQPLPEKCPDHPDGMVAFIEESSEFTPEQWASLANLRQGATY